jgi:hypothetical protein
MTGSWEAVILTPHFKKLKEISRSLRKNRDHDEFNPSDVDATWRQVFLDRDLHALWWCQAVPHRHVALVMLVSAAASAAESVPAIVPEF